jgi:FkbM family methyltransferase
MISRSILREITRHYPLNRPRWRLLQMLPDLGAARGEFSIKRGLRLRAYPGGGDYICKQAYWFGDFDPWVDKTLIRLSRPGDIVIDIGANIGTTTLCLARAVGPTGRVIAFEPFPSNFEMLRSNIEANGLQQVEAWPVALSDHTGIGRMIGADGQAGQAQMEEVKFDPAAAQSWLGRVEGERTEVKTFSFDKWIQDQGISSVNVCKIDVEGFEETVLGGMHDTLQRQLIQAFVIERHVDWQIVDDSIFELLGKNGYRVYRIDKGLRAVRYSTLGSPPSGQPSHDFVAVLKNSECAHRIGQWINHRLAGPQER